MPRRLLAALLLLPFLASVDARPLDIPALWDFDDPAASEARFRASLEGVPSDEKLELQTQIARTYSLRRRFDDAHRLLDTVEPRLATAGPAPRVRYLLERGRTWRSSGEPGRARPLFIQAWDIASDRGLDGLAVDAAHMVALVEPGTDGQLEWNRRALAIAERSNEAYARRWQASLHNNLGWSLHDAGRYDEALVHFEATLRERRAQGNAAWIREARWAVARCQRSLKRLDTALDTQLALERELATAGATDGYVLEEIAELYAELGKDDQARPYFRRAAAELAKDEWFVTHETARLARLRERGG